MRPGLSYFFGYSSPCSSSNAYQGTVTLYYWENAPGASAGILGLEVKCNDETEYLQFCPKSMAEVADRAWDKLTHATEGDFVKSLEDAKLIEGYRRNQKIRQGDSLYLLGDNEKLAIVKALSQSVQNSLAIDGLPTKTIELSNLDAHIMLAQIKALKKDPPYFAPMSGSGIGATENSASIIYKILQAGGADKVSPPLNEELMRLSLDYLAIPIGVVGAVAAGPLAGLQYSLYSVLAARFAGSAIEGHKAVSSLITLMKKEKTLTHYLPAGLGLDLLYSALSGIGGVFAPGSAPMRVNVLPEDVLKLAESLQAVNECDLRGELHSLGSLRL